MSYLPLQFYTIYIIASDKGGPYCQWNNIDMYQTEFSWNGKSECHVKLPQEKKSDWDWSYSSSLADILPQDSSMAKLEIKVSFLHSNFQIICARMGYILAWV
jgi:hypothetical protein